MGLVGVVAMIATIISGRDAQSDRMENGIQDGIPEYLAAVLSVCYLGYVMVVDVRKDASSILYWPACFLPVDIPSAIPIMRSFMIPALAS